MRISWASAVVIQFKGESVPWYLVVVLRRFFSSSSSIHPCFHRFVFECVWFHWPRQCADVTLGIVSCFASSPDASLTLRQGCTPPKAQPLPGVLYWSRFESSSMALSDTVTRVTGGALVCTTLRASLSGTFLQTLPDLVTPLKGHSLSPGICPATRSAPSERFGY